MRRLLIIIMALYGLSISAHNQSKLDSLRTLIDHGIQRRNNELIANSFAQIGWIYFGQGKYDSAAFYYHKSLGTPTDDRKLIASNYNALGIIYNNKGLSDSAVSNYKKGLNIYIEDKDTTHATVIENNLAIVYKNQGQYEKALESVFSALRKLEKLAPNRAVASAYNTVGSVYAKMGDNLNALIYYRKALHVRQGINYQRGIGQSYSNIGDVFTVMNMNDSALSNLLKSNEVLKAESDYRGIGATANSIGMILMRQKKFAEAESYFLESVAIKRTFGERLDEAIALNNLGELKLATGDLRAATRYLNSAEFIVRQSNALDQLQRNLELQVSLYKAKHDTRKALRTIEELLAVKDSLLTKDKAESLYSMQVRYETEKKEQQIALLENEKALQESELRSSATWIWSLIVTVFLLIVIVLLVYVSLRIARTSKKRVETLLKEVHHRVKNNLQLLSSVFSLYSQKLTDEKAVQAVKSSEARINAMALIHRKLYNVEQNRTINIKEYIMELMQYLTNAYGYNEKPITVSCNIKDVQVDVDKAIPLGLIMNELISNAFKYAYDGHLDPRLDVTLDVINDNLLISIGDNGKGIDDEMLTKSESFGLKMVNTFIKELRGSLETDVVSGTNYSLVIPL